jgi:hypothetical protein
MSCAIYFCLSSLHKGGETLNTAVLRIRDVYHGSQILIVNHPGSRISDNTSNTSNTSKVIVCFMLGLHHEIPGNGQHCLPSRYRLHGRYIEIVRIPAFAIRCPPLHTGDKIGIQT